MATWWYIGPNQFRFIGSGDWANYGIVSNDTSWSAVNGWGVDEGLLSSAVKSFLAARSAEFTLASVDPLARTPYDNGLDPERIYNLSKLIADQLYATKDALAAAFLNVSVNLDNVYAKLAAGRLSINGTQLTPANIGADAAGTAQGIMDASTAGAPSSLNTIAELAAALNNSPTQVNDIITALGLRVRADAAQTLTTGQKTQARANIGAAAVTDITGAFAPSPANPATAILTAGNLVTNAFNIIDNSAGAGTYNLPATNNKGEILVVIRKDNANNAATITTTAAGKFINVSGNQTIVVRGLYSGVVLQGDGANNWYTVGINHSIQFLDSRYLPAGGAGNYVSYDSGGRVTTATPASGTDAANKNYVDALGVDAVTANTIVRRDSAGRITASLPTSPSHVATRQYVDAVSIAGGTADPQPGSGMARDGDGRSSVLTPVLPNQIVNKAYADDRQASKTFKRVIRTVGASVPAVTWTDLDFYGLGVTALDDWNDGSFRVESTTPGAVRVGANGTYMVIGSSFFGGGTGFADETAIRIMVNGNFVEGSYNSGMNGLTTTSIVKANVGDYIRAQYYVTDTGANVDYRPFASCAITITRMGPL